MHDRWHRCDGCESDYRQRTGWSHWMDWVVVTLGALAAMSLFGPWGISMARDGAAPQRRKRFLREQLYPE